MDLCGVWHTILAWGRAELRDWRLVLHVVANAKFFLITSGNENRVLI